ncbi:MAG: exodeoxyribonuclease V subunit gamma, partial [Deltaproteobacteria bacterium]|nr:exodeoxyribonuclease V subunit gamma [Deltaproteobacteria bacterium]
MPGLKVYTSNRMEILCRHLAASLEAPLRHPLAPEVILVQSKGMERWLSMELAKRHGICANCRFPYPIHFVNDLFHHILLAVPEKSPYEPGIMTWDVMNILPGLLDQPSFKSIGAYLGKGEGDLKLFQLADRIAGLFDQYLLFRPDMILGWEQGRDEDWQALLWRAIAARKGPIHRAALYQQLLTALREKNLRPAGIPERISLFGISALPPFHIQILGALSVQTDIHMFLMNPCREFWGDIVSDQAADRIVAGRKDIDLEPDDLYLDAGNSLLASMGTLGRDFFKMMADLPAEEQQEYEDPGESTILKAIQSDVLNLRERHLSAANGSCDRDASIQIHSCHSPLREIEALKDYLFSVFAENPHIQADDVLVMIPQIETYAPFIQAVFSLPPDDPHYIPFSIADRGLLQECNLIATFLKILSLPGSRVTAAAVLDILQSAAVQKKYSLSEEDLELIHHWIRETGIRWGVDGDHKKAFGLPGIWLNTWRAGLDRLLLGYALPSGEDNELFEGMIPYGDIEGADAQILGRFLSFVETLFSFIAPLEEKGTLCRWADLLGELVAALFSGDGDEMRDMQSIRSVLAELIDIAGDALFREDVGLNVIKAWLKKNLEDKGAGYGFLGGGVTFCTILPMRSIPFTCVCMVGMNDESYPRQSRPLGFDLMAKKPRSGDRTRRSDDRYLFLEAMLSAREKLYISYCGQSMKDNSLKPPSVLVSELADYIETGFGKAVREGICVKHHLQAFSPEYFSGRGSLFSYSEENLRAARSASAPHRPQTAFITEGLSEPPDKWKRIDLNTLCRFFANPARFFLNHCLGIYLDELPELPEENEPFELDHLDRYFMKQDLAGWALQGRNIEDYRQAAAVRGKLPHGAPGSYLYDSLSRETAAFVNRVRPHLSGGLKDPIDAVIAVGDYELKGRLTQIYGDHQFQYRPAKLKAADRLRAWIHHLILNHPAAGAPTATTILIAEDQAVSYGPVDGAEDYLRVLLELYWEGLRKPLHFFPESSMIYMESAARGKAGTEALRSARNKWDAYLYPEKSDPHYELC